MFQFFLKSISNNLESSETNTPDILEIITPTITNIFHLLNLSFIKQLLYESQFYSFYNKTSLHFLNIKATEMPANI